jgi:exodeoxyribonuclease VII large subunit
MQVGVERRDARLGELARTLHAVSPLATLDRGYAILFERESGAVVRSIAQAPAGSTLHARLADGELRVTVGDR